MTQTFNKIIFAFMVIVFASCTSKKEHLSRTTISLMVDQTETNRIIPTTNSLLKLYGFEQNICKAVTFRFTPISDLLRTPELEFSFENRIEEEKSGNLNDDPLFRKKQIIRFENDIAKCLSTIPLQMIKEKKETTCFEKICLELNTLSKKDGHDKVLIISSDMIENSHLLNGYSEGLYHSIEENNQRAQRSLMKKFKNEDLLPKSLDGMKIYILFTPKTKKEDVLFKAFSNVYRKLLEELDAKVYIKSSNELKHYNE